MSCTRQARLLLISGASGVGKTTLSKELGAALGISQIKSTDSIRRALCAQFDANTKPALFRHSFEPAGGNAIADWHATIDALDKNITTLIDSAITTNTDLLLEGVHVLPSIKTLEKWREAGGKACGVVLHITDEDSHKRLIEKREGKNKQRKRLFLSNFTRIRNICDEMLKNAEDARWLFIDPFNLNDSIRLIREGFH